MQELKNPKFEEGTTSPNYWNTYSTGTKQKCTYPEPGRTGGRSVAITYVTRDTGKVTMYTQTVKIDRTKKYKLSGRMKTQNIIGSGASIRVGWRDINGKYLNTTMIMSRQKGTIPWKYFEGIVIPNQNAVSATVGLDLYDCSGKVWFDDISFSDITTLKYACSNGKCIQDPNGQYNSLADCQATLKYTCINDQCVVACPDYHGTKYDTLAECQKVCGQHPGYHLVWSDEFDSNSIGTKWFNRGDPKYAYIQNGNLHLKLDVIDGNVHRGYVNSGSDSSNTLKLGPYGFLEMRCKVSNKYGVDNQLWLTSPGWGAPGGFEVDIGEYVPRRKQYSVNALYAENIGSHWRGSNIFGDISGNYHVWQFEWTPDKYVWYRDDIKIFEMTKIQYSQWISDKPMMIQLCLCGTYGYPGCDVQGVGDQITDLNELPTEFIIDYVRFYQKDINTKIHPNIFLNQADIDVIKERVNKDPWKGAYNKFISTDASTAVNMPIQTVTSKGKIPPSGDKHDYYSDPPYSSDGVYNPNADRTDYESAMKVGHAVRDLGLAYAITGDTKYADKAVQLINAWTVNPTTKMNPTVKIFNAQSYIEPVITIPGMFYGADLIWNYPGWSVSDRDAFVEWTRKFTVWLNTWEGYNDNNNYELRRIMTVAIGAVITEDSVNMQRAIDRWKYVMPLNMNTQGLMVKEYQRTRGFFYSLAGINGLMATAEIARHQGIDLYNYKTPDGRCIKLALDFHAPYASGIKAWPYKEIHPELVEYALFELAHARYKGMAYKNVVIKRGRPMYEIRVIGPITLTHGSAFV